MRQAVLMMCCLLLFAGDALALTGNKWKTLSPPLQSFYVMGVADAWFNMESTRLETNRLITNKEHSIGPSIFTHIVNCAAQRMTYEQITAIVQKYMDNNPSRWHYNMSSLVWNALNEVCPPPDLQAK